MREPLSLTQANIAHPKHSYKLRGLDILRANQVWSTDITYVKIAGGMVYLAAVIDWYSKAVLSQLRRYIVTQKLTLKSILI